MRGPRAPGLLRGTIVSPDLSHSGQGSCIIGKKAGGPSVPRPEALRQARGTKPPPPPALCLPEGRPTLGLIPRPNPVLGRGVRWGGEGTGSLTGPGLKASCQVWRVGHPSRRRMGPARKQTDPGEDPQTQASVGGGGARCPHSAPASLLIRHPRGMLGVLLCAPPPAAAPHPPPGSGLPQAPARSRPSSPPQPAGQRPSAFPEALGLRPALPSPGADARRRRTRSERAAMRRPRLERREPGQLHRRRLPRIGGGGRGRRLGTPAGPGAGSGRGGASGEAGPRGAPGAACQVRKPRLPRVLIAPASACMGSRASRGPTH